MARTRALLVTALLACEDAPASGVLDATMSDVDAFDTLEVIPETLEVIPDGSREPRPDGAAAFCRSASDPAGSGCPADTVCLDGTHCYPLAGTTPERCGVAARFTIDITGPAEPAGVTATRRYAGVVRAHAGGSLTLETPSETVIVTYAIGPYTLPVVVGDEVVMDVLTSAGWITTMGLALWTGDGALLALVDEGKFGSAWLSRATTTEQRGGFDITTEPMGCATSDDNFCATSIPLGQRFTYGTWSALVAPGQASDLATNEGTFQVINAWAEELADLQCTDIGPMNAWAILAKGRR